MPYCVNCGAAYLVRYPFCEACLADPLVPVVQMEQVLARRRREQLAGAPGDSPEFRFPGEHSRLLYAILIAGAVSIFLGLFTFSIYILLLVVTLVGVRLSMIRLRASGVSVDEHTLPEIDRLRRLAAYRVGIAAPPVFIEQTPVLNAYASGFWGDGFIVLNSGLIEALTKAELLAVLGHEMAHLRHAHATWMALAYPVQRQFRLWPVTDILQLFFNAWHLKAEYTADRGSLLATRALTPAIRTQLKLALGAEQGGTVAIDRYLDGAEPRTEDPVESWSELAGTHPFLRNRVGQILSFARSERYQVALGLDP